jgi:hypothetical protein
VSDCGARRGGGGVGNSYPCDMRHATCDQVSPGSGLNRARRAGQILPLNFTRTMPTGGAARGEG